MNARMIFFGILFFELAYDLFRLYLIDKQRKLPLPIEVSDIYEPQRYQTYLAYTKDNRSLYLKKKAISVILNCLMIFTPFFYFIEQISSGSIYKIFFITFAINMVIELVESYIVGYINTFKIQDKYGLNKKDLKEFIRSYCLSEIPNIFVSLLLYVLLIFICEYMASWTNQFNISFLKAFVLGLGILVGFGIVVMLVSILSIVILKKQYTFTPLEDGELKDQINELQKDSKKKVKKIYIYDESKKSTRKNAFLLRFLWIREFGIADNFIKGNSQRELLAVLSHEIGHLKHKKTIWNYLIYAFFVVMFIGIVYLISHGQLVISISNWVNQSFNLKLNNYYLLFAFYMNLYKPFDAVVSVYASNVTRLEEYEADREAVKNGYGDELILTFKRLSSDELINVNPSPLIEFLEYDHPGMYRRIKAILNEKNKLSL